MDNADGDRDVIPGSGLPPSSPVRLIGKEHDSPQSSPSNRTRRSRLGNMFRPKGEKRLSVESKSARPRKDSGPKRVMRKLKEYDSEQQTDDDYGDVESRYPRTLQFQSDEEDEKSAAVVASKSEGEDQKWAVEKDKKRRLSGERHKVGSGSSPKDSSPKEKEKEKGKEKKDLRSLFNLPSRQPAPQAQANFGTIGKRGSQSVTVVLCSETNNTAALPDEVASPNLERARSPPPAKSGDKRAAFLKIKSSQSHASWAAGVTRPKRLVKDNLSAKMSNTDEPFLRSRDVRPGPDGDRRHSSPRNANGTSSLSSNDWASASDPSAISSDSAFSHYSPHNTYTIGAGISGGPAQPVGLVSYDKKRGGRNKSGRESPVALSGYPPVVPSLNTRGRSGSTLEDILAEKAARSQSDSSSSSCPSRSASGCSSVRSPKSPIFAFKTSPGSSPLASPTSCCSNSTSSVVSSPNSPTGDRNGNTTTATIERRAISEGRKKKRSKTGSHKRTRERKRGGTESRMERVTTSDMAPLGQRDFVSLESGSLSVRDRLKRTRSDSALDKRSYRLRTTPSSGVLGMFRNVSPRSEADGGLVEMRRRDRSKERKKKKKKSPRGRSYPDESEDDVIALKLPLSASLDEDTPHLREGSSGNRLMLEADQTLSSLSSIQDYTSLGRQFSAVFVRTNTDDMLDKDDSLSSSNSRTSSGSSTSVLVLAANQHHQAAMRSDAMRRGRDKEREEKRLKALKIESNPPKDDDEKDRLSEKAKDRKHRRRPSAGSSVEKVSSAAEAEVLPVDTVVLPVETAYEDTFPNGTVKNHLVRPCFEEAEGMRVLTSGTLTQLVAFMLTPPQNRHFNRAVILSYCYYAPACRVLDELLERITLEVDDRIVASTQRNIVKIVREWVRYDDSVLLRPGVPERLNALSRTFGPGMDCLDRQSSFCPPLSPTAPLYPNASSSHHGIAAPSRSAPPSPTSQSSGKSSNNDDNTSSKNHNNNNNTPSSSITESEKSVPSSRSSSACSSSDEASQPKESRRHHRRTRAESLNIDDRPSSPTSTLLTGVGLAAASPPVSGSSPLSASSPPSGISLSSPASTTRSTISLPSACCAYTAETSPSSPSLSPTSPRKVEEDDPMSYPKPLLPRNVQSLDGSISALSSLLIHPLETARQITLIDLAMLRSIRTHELLKRGWLSQEKEQRSKNVLAFAGWFNRVTFWVATEIVMSLAEERRVSTIKHFIDVAEHMLALNNFNGMMSILSGLSHNAVSRLKKTWKLVDQKHQKRLHALELLMESKRNFRGYRQRLAKTPPPLIPFQALFLGDMVGLENMRETVSDGGINFNKMYHIGKAIIDFHRYQSADYKLLAIPSLQNFFL